MRSTAARTHALIAAIALLSAITASCADPVVDEPQTWDDRIEPLAHFVESHRGHTFERPVKVKYLSDADFERLTSLGGGPNSTSDRADKRLQQLGIAPSGATASQQAQQGSKLVGLYQPSNKSLLVREGDFDDQTRAVVVHELTHALQDQVFGMPTSTPNNVDAVIATSAVIEGDATRIESDYRTEVLHERAPTPEGSTPEGSAPSGSATPTDDDTTKPTGPTTTTPTDFDPHLITGSAAVNWWTTLFPYSSGALYIEQMAATGADLDQLFNDATDYRLSTAMVLGLRLPGDGDPALPTANDNSQDDAGPFGALRWYAALGGAKNPDLETVVAAMLHESVVVTNSCVTSTIDFDSDPSATAFVQQSLAWTGTMLASARQSDATVTMQWCPTSDTINVDATGFIPILRRHYALAALMASGKSLPEANASYGHS